MTTEPRNADLLRLAKALGVTPAAVAGEVRRMGALLGEPGAKERGVSEQRLYQIASSGALLDRRRLLLAVVDAARAAGAKEHVIEAIAGAIVPDLATLTHPIAGYIEDLARGAVQG